MTTSQQHDTAIVWFRRDLRLGDNPALTAALESARRVIPVFVADPSVDAMGACAKWRLGLSLRSLTEDLEAAGSRLIVRRGRALDEIGAIAAVTGATVVHYCRDYSPTAINRDTELKGDLKARGMTVESHAGLVLFEPWTVKTGSGGYYRVYSPMWRAVRDREVPEALPAPQAIPGPDKTLQSLSVADLGLGAGMMRGAPVVARHMCIGERAARARLERFIDGAVGGYKADRDFPMKQATSGLSENLTYGEISPRTIWHAGRAALRDGAAGAEHFLKELVWREFAYHLMYHSPHMLTDNWREGWEVFPWRADNEDAEKWRRGQTGEPLVDAAMRELYATGTMHNRMRMVAASYLTKHLMTDWRVGRDWFAECLADWDPASNAMGWQWVAGSGPDAAPFFRIFNPNSQADKFDGDCRYRDHFLQGAGAEDFAAAIPRSWGDTAPPRRPIVDLKYGRQRALDAYEQMKARSSEPA